MQVSGADISHGHPPAEERMVLTNLSLAAPGTAHLLGFVVPPICEVVGANASPPASLRSARVHPMSREGADRTVKVPSDPTRSIALQIVR